MTDFDVAIVGSGAAGVSAARPLLEAGLKAVILDGGEARRAEVPSRAYLDERERGARQWEWMVGAPGAVDFSGTSSPKLKAPTLAHAFSGFTKTNRLSAANFLPIGSLAPGGLTEAWGAGVAAFDEQELGPFPFGLADLEPHYRAVAARIGVSGPASDDLDGHYGVLAPQMRPVPLDTAGEVLGGTYVRQRRKLASQGFALGRARLAVLTEDRPGRSACDSRGLCLWGCPRSSIYSAAQEIDQLDRHRNCTYLSGTLVEGLRRDGDDWLLLGRDRGSNTERPVRARRVLLAAGVIATTKLALQLLERFDEPVRLLSTPTSAFMIFQPRVLAMRSKEATALAQHWFTLKSDMPDKDVCGGLFSISNLPMSEFLPHVPLNLRSGIDLLSAIYPALTAGNLFFHSKWSSHRLTAKADGGVRIDGGFAEGFAELHAGVARRLKRSFRNLSAWTLPGSFAVAPPGSDAHYAGTLPMRAQPGPGETHADGELAGARGVHVVDGSCLSDLPPKSHTLTIMANAERIALKVAALAGGQAARA